ncbi:MAG: OB-fold domain-containing protein, partial [Rhodococcus fascians]
MTASQSSPASIDDHLPPLSAPLKLSFDYTRSVGSVLSSFFTELRGRHVVGIRGSDGRVHVPPAEFDPVTYEPLSEIVPVASVGTVLSWTWQPQPLEGQPLDRPFAWALIKLDGADTALLHAVDAGSSESISTGARVHVHWADETVGAITDIAYFALGDTPEDVPEEGRDDRDPVTMLVVPTMIEIQHTASLPESAFLRGLEEGKLLGARTGSSGKVYFPPREADPGTGLATTEFVELPDRGTVTTFAIINIPFAGQKIKPPYVAAYVLLDGADIPFLHLILEIDAADVRMGMRVEAV